MTDTVEVYRGDGLRRGADVVEPLLSDSMLVIRGKAEMDAHAHAFNSIKVEVVFNPHLRLGQLVELPDPTSNVMFRGKITSIQVTSDPPDLSMTIGVERPL